MSKVTFKLRVLKASVLGMASLLLVFMMAMPVALAVPGTAFADEADPTARAETVLDAADYAPFVIDEVGLLKEGDYQDFEARCEEMSQETGVGVYLALVDSIGDEEVRDYAIDFYKSNDLGMGDERSGILFLISVNSRKYVTVTYGAGLDVFTDYRIDQMEEEIVSDLKENRFVRGCDDYVTLCEETVDYYLANGEGMSRDNDPVAQKQDRGIGIAISAVAAVAIAGGVCFGLRKQLKSVEVACSASNYELSDAFHLSDSDDKFEGVFISKTPKPKSDSDSGGGGGFGGSSGGSF